MPLPRMRSLPLHGATLPCAVKVRVELERAILRAAGDELVESGYARLTMDRVARRAGTNKNAIYRRWPSRAVAHGEAAPEALHPRVATVAMIGLSRRQPLGTRTAAV
jgi:AcrR family transcriptional regulator